MTLALGLLATAALIGLLGPRYLHRTVSPGFRPGLALTGWITSSLVVAGSAVAGAVLLSMPHNASADSLIGMTTACINTGEHVWETVLRLSGTVVVLGATVRTLFVAVRRSRQDAVRRHEHLSLLRFVGHGEPDDPSLYWLPESTPVAYSVGGREGAIVATTGLAGLEPTTRAAILTHERAHLRGRHHRLVLLVEVLARALPFVPLFRAAPPAVRVLVELAADATAARSCGCDGVRDALRAVTADFAPPASLAMSRDAVELRLRWLDPERGAACSGTRHRAGYAAAALASLSPAVAGVGGITGLVLLLCLGVGSPM